MTLRNKSRSFLLVAFAVAVFASSASHARAEFLTALTGNSRMFDGAPTDGLVNFSVYRTVDSNWTNDAAFAGSGLQSLLAGGSVDTDTRFVFLWQVVNDNPSGGGNPSLSILRTPLGPGGSYSSIGFFLNTVFVDAAGAVGPVGNQRLGALPGSADPGVQDGDDVPNGVPSESGVAAPTFGINLLASAPSSALLDDGTGRARVNWSGAGVLSNNRYSAVVFMTSDSPLMPAYGTGLIGSGVAFSNGDTPAPFATPEPASFMLFASGLAGLMACRAWQRRTQRPSTCSGELS